MHLEWWSPEEGCMREKDSEKAVWIKLAGLPLHLWMRDILKRLGDACGGLLEIDPETLWQTNLRLAGIKVSREVKERPFVLNILAGARSYEVQIWWELPPWFECVFPKK